METHKLAPILLKLSILLLATTATTIPVATAATELCHPDDKKALLGIKSWFNDNYLFASWLPDRDCCKEWYMVKCDLTTHRIISLSVASYANLSGTIPPSVADLPFLQTLFFRKLPNLTGTIPPSVASLRHLSMAFFDNNALSGPVPPFFASMSSLQQLSLAFNRFSGSIPPSLALAPSLIFLDLSRNLLTGPIPASFGSFNSSPVTLILSHNQLSGPVPGSLGKVDFLHIDFSRNNLTGDASFLFGPEDKTVQIIDLSRNQLAFDFSKVETSSPPSITSLDLNHNRVFGGFPSTGLDKVYYLNVSYNRLCGPIPNVGELPTFDQTAYFHNKCLCGPPLPACNSTA